ncbi:hypothetical protein EPUS_05662 [Endocarpon pusillum Z07020]|uniref:Dyp-type peroxidase n=1 Tax=Endocarpon pusillum (strain Z07020 / HMAS-L-300199) TaxID=1263415 RepID=U1G963_ENDPU|nr:uncharacterized protein EPUS_05662 [Endocarpon pusillum Z07020]ERF68523.1 hypothetical protein EPUS_05662 [Endocarpon pusillum Z07020]
MASPLDLNNIQGDILKGFPKKTETFYFFRIDDNRVKEFREQLTELVPLITTTNQIKDDRRKIDENKKKGAERQHGPPKLLKMCGVGLSFSHKGLEKIGIRDDIGDANFKDGMLADAKDLGDQGSFSSDKFDPDWIPEFKEEIHGLIQVAGDCHDTVKDKLEEIKDIFSVGDDDATIHKVFRVTGDIRPGAHKGHEHFGFLDGISDPAVQGVDTNPLPGQETIRQGIILLGREGDEFNRPPWAVDGSFLAFRYLPQRVPEFNAFLKNNAIPIPDPSKPPELGMELLGARLVGRWKSGAPVDISPLGDDKALAKDPNRRNDFRYDPLSQERCPFAAHIRKTNPRSDLDSTEANRIIRRGIQYGPEVSAAEAATKRTTKDRGLLFACYQSNIANGFKFIQQSWANRVDFPFGKPIDPGFDPIIGPNQ